MDSEDSRDDNADAQSSSSKSSSRSASPKNESYSKAPQSPTGNAKSSNFAPSSPSSYPASPNPYQRNCDSNPRSPSPENQSQSPQHNKGPQSPESNTNSLINSPDNSPGKSGPKTPQCPSPKEDKDSSRSGPASPDANSPSASPMEHAEPKSPSPNHYAQHANEWGTGNHIRRKNKAEQKLEPMPRSSRSRSNSSQSSQDSSYNKRSSGRDPPTEEISEGEMESDQENAKPKKTKAARKQGDDGKLNMSHEDLSDVSESDSDVSNSNSYMPDDGEKDKSKVSQKTAKVEVNGNGTDHHSSELDNSKIVSTPKLDKVPQEKTSNTEDGEEQLDFEAEEGECVEPKSVEDNDGEIKSPGKDVVGNSESRSCRASSPEEGEVSDEAERRPEESEPRPVCRFFARGACTWGISCRFLHPGVTDKGNYSMFEMVRNVPAHAIHGPPHRIPEPMAAPESAWERGLRTAKEMLRIATKRKEQDMDFEEKKLHLSVGGVVHDPDAELAYAAAAVGASPPHNDMEHTHTDGYSRGYGPPMGYGGRPPRMLPPRMIEERERERDNRYYERERPYERETRYEKPYYEAPPPDDEAYHKRRVRPSREVIVQRAEVKERERERDRGRGERERERGEQQWADPWMRPSPANRRPRRSSDEDSSSSSRSSRSMAKKKRRPSSSSRQRVSPSVIVRERRLLSARSTAMNPPAPRRRSSPNRTLAANPPNPHKQKDGIDPYGRNKGSRRKRYSRTSSSGSGSSSSSSESESESHSSSSSGSSSDTARRGRQARLLNAAGRSRINPKAGLAAAVSVGKKEMEKESKKRPASPTEGPPSKKSVSRREELLKQLKAVEDAIARKRSKI